MNAVMGTRDQTSARQALWRGAFPQALLGRDALLGNQFPGLPWWFEVAIDLFGCDPVLLRTEALVAAFLLALCDQLKVHRFSEIRLVPLDQDRQVKRSVVALVIETGSLVVHLATPTNAMCLTILACQAFAAYRTAAFCQQWLSARAGQLIVSFRGPPAPEQEEWHHERPGLPERKRTD